MLRKKFPVCGDSSKILKQLFFNGQKINSKTDINDILSIKLRHILINFYTLNILPDGWN